MLVWQSLPPRFIQPKYYINGFPKSGLHLVTLMLAPFVRPQPQSALRQNEWIGTYDHHSWTLEKMELGPQLYCLSELDTGHFMKGHAGYFEEFETFMRRSGIAHVFVYRDLRDVAVSQTYHWIDDNDIRYKHEDKSFFRKMDFDDVLLAVIKGIGPYPGIFERWEKYAPWLDRDDTYSVSFEQLRSNPKKQANALVRHGYSVLSRATRLSLRLDETEMDNLTNMMVESAGKTYLSPTYRKGEVGSWRDEFEDYHVAAFRRADTNGWLVRLGYEESEEWQ